MTAAEKHIRHFNRMNGNEVRKDTLQNFYAKVQAVDGLDTLKAKLQKAIRMMGKERSAVIKFKPLKAAAPSKLNGVDPGMLYGLQHIQNDEGLEGKSLGGLSDTTYKVITDRIMELIRAGGLIWQKPWNEKVNGSTMLAHNYVTKHIYRAGNYYLNFLTLESGIEILRNGKKIKISYKTPYFFSFKSVTELGGKVKKGEQGWPVVYFKWLYKDLKKNKLVPEKEARTTGGGLKPGYQRIPGLFYYTVFNYDQCEGLKIKIEKKRPKTEQERIESAEKIVYAMPKKPIIKVQGTEAWYRRDIDTVQVPPIVSFKKVQHFYSTQFHELIHSTGHPNRVFREREATRRFGDKNYAFEELIAELGASFLCGESGILYFTMRNSAAYIASWSKALLREMKADPKFFLRAASQAQKAADFILARGEYEKLKRKGAKPVATKRGKKKASLVESHKVAKSPVSKRENKSSRPPVKRAKRVKDTRETSRAVSKPATAFAGFTTADQAPAQPQNLFRLPGVMGELLGDLQRYKLEIVIAGETHSSKSELGKQIADAFISLGDDVAWIDWEQGGLASRDTKNSIIRNVRPENHKKLFVNGELTRSLEAVKALAGKFKVIGIDSGTKLNQVTNAWIDELREQHPNTVWIILMQQNEKGGTRGGSSAEFDSPVVIKTYRPDESDFRKNYAYVFKNRGNRTGLYYNISDKQIIPNPAKS